MILPDTNVLSETMRQDGDAHVRAWLDRQPPAQLLLAAPVLAELMLGVALLPEGARKERLRLAIELLVRRLQPRVVSFDERAARTYGRLIASARSRGRSIGVMDGQIAAIALVHRASVATRDASPFQAAGVDLVDPWQPA